MASRVITTSKKDDTPRHFVARFPGGAAYSGFSVIFAAAIEQESGHTLQELFTGGFVGSSGGSFPASVASLPHPTKPDRPLYTMDRFETVFFGKLPMYLDYHNDHYLNHVIRHIARRQANGEISLPKGGIAGFLTRKFIQAAVEAHLSETQIDKIKGVLDETLKHGDIPLHIDRKPMEEDLEKLLGQYHLRDARRSLCITTQKINPGRVSPYDFYYVEPGLLKDDAPLHNNRPEVNIPLHQIILASTAFPTAYASYTIPELGMSFSDAATVDTGVDNAMIFREHLKDGYELGFVHIGNTDHNRPITPEQYDHMDMIDMVTDNTRFLISGIGHQAQIRGRRTLREIIGRENFYAIEIDIAKPPIPINFNLNILDTSPGQIEKMREFGHNFVEHERSRLILPIAERLVENKHRLDAVKDSTAAYQSQDKEEQHEDKVGLQDFAKAAANDDEVVNSDAKRQKEEPKVFRLGRFELTIHKSKPPRF